MMSARPVQSGRRYAGSFVVTGTGRATTMSDSARALLVAGIALAIILTRLALAAVRADPSSAARLVAELRLAQFAAMMLMLSAGAYIGFALAQEWTTGSGLDVALAVGFLALASIAVTRDPRLALTLLALAFAGHAGVDLLHGAGMLPPESMPPWYATACAVYDVGVAGVCYFPIVYR